MINNFVGFFGGPELVLLGFVVLGSENLFWGILTKNKIFYQLSFLEFYADSEF